MNDLRIAFFGTPEFAVPSLKILLDNKCNIKAVVTAPDKPAGRGQKITYCPVKEFALQNNLKILQPENLKDENFINELKNLGINLQVVVAFRMLPEQVWKLPEFGTFNLHASLLPQYRGAAPINWALINGEKETGVTTFFIEKDIDTGKIILQDKLSILESDNASSLHNKLMVTGAQLVLKTVRQIETGTLLTSDQSNMIKGALYPAPKLNKQNTRIRFDWTVNRTLNFIRGLSSYPGAHCELHLPRNYMSLMIKIFSATGREMKHDKTPGSLETDNKTFLRAYVADGYIELGEILLAGRAKMHVKDFLNGFTLEQDWRFI